jgi:OPT family oligopeptide transporter
MQNDILNSSSIDTHSSSSTKKKPNEITIRSTVLMVVIGCILSSANTYLGLYSGFPISVSIPSAIISLSILKTIAYFLKRKNENTILEVNWIQTGASAGSVVSGATLITIPALIELGYWTKVNYWETTGIVILGSALGVFFSIPLRKTLIEKEQLKFPEGTATAVVLKTLAETNSDENKELFEIESQEDSIQLASPSDEPIEHIATGDEAKSTSTSVLHIPTYFAISLIIGGSIIGSLFKFCEIGLSLWNSSFSTAFWYGKSSAMFYISFISSPALLAIGYIVEFNIGFVVFSGAATAFWFGVPAAAQVFQIRYIHANAATAAVSIFQSQIRYLGVGAMAIGSIFSILAMSRSLWHGLVAYSKSLKIAVYDLLKREVKESERVNTEDLPVWLQLLFSLVIMACVFILLSLLMESVWIGILASVFIAFAGFMFAASSGYMAG